MKQKSHCTFFRDCLLVYGPQGPTLVSVFKVTCVLGASIIVSLGLYMSSISYISPSESTTLMTSQVAFVYVISIIFLGQRPVLIKVLIRLDNVFGSVLAFLDIEPIGTGTI